MRKHIITGTAIIACVTLSSAVWPRSSEVGDLPVEPIKTTEIAEIGARSEEKAQIILFNNTHIPELGAVAESEPEKDNITTEEKTQTSEPTQAVQSTQPSASSSELRMGDVRVVNGEKQIYILGFGWIKDEGGGSIGITVGGKGDINKQVGVMGGGTTVGNPGDELTGNKVGIMGADDASASNTNPAPGTKKYIDGKPHVWVPGFGWVEDQGGESIGTVAEDMYENGHKIGSMGGSESQVRSTTPPSEQPEPTGDEIHIVFVEVPEKNSTPPLYKPDTTSP